MTFYERLNLLMKKNNITGKQLTTDLGIARNSITYWKKNGNIPKNNILNLLAKYFNCSVEYLLVGNDDKVQVSNNKDITFWIRFYNLCVENNTKPNPLGNKLGISSGSITRWKNGGIPNSKTLELIGNYFNCSIDYLLGKSNTKDKQIDNIPSTNNYDMMFWNRFYNLCVVNNTKPNPLGVKLGIPSATIAGWKRGSSPNAIYILKIAKYFDCSTDYLLGNTDIIKESTIDIPSNNDTIVKLIKIIINLSPENLNLILALAEQLEKGQSEE